MVACAPQVWVSVRTLACSGWPPLRNFPCAKSRWAHPAWGGRAVRGGGWRGRSEFSSRRHSRGPSASPEGRRARAGDTQGAEAGRGPTADLPSSGLSDEHPRFCPGSDKIPEPV